MIYACACACSTAFQLNIKFPSIQFISKPSVAYGVSELNILGLLLNQNMSHVLDSFTINITIILCNKTEPPSLIQMKSRNNEENSVYKSEFQISLIQVIDLSLCFSYKLIKYNIGL